MAQSTASAIDKKIVKTMDVTGDGKADEIILHLKAKDMKAPFKWSLTIISGGKIVYSHDSDDTWLDQNFNDVGYVSDCDNYLSCKNKYYFHDILQSLVLTGDKWYTVNGILDKSQSNTLYPLGRKQLRECCNITGSRADAILRKIENKLRAGNAVALNVLISPVQAEAPMIFAPEVGRFLIIYDD